MVIEKAKTTMQYFGWINRVKKKNSAFCGEKKFLMTISLYNINLQNVHGWNFILTNRCHTVSILRLGRLLPLANQPCLLVFLQHLSVTHPWMVSGIGSVNFHCPRQTLLHPGLFLMAAEVLQTFFFYLSHAEDFL